VENECDESGQILLPRVQHLFFIEDEDTETTHVSKTQQINKTRQVNEPNQVKKTQLLNKTQQINKTHQVNEPDQVKKTLSSFGKETMCTLVISRLNNHFKPNHSQMVYHSIIKRLCGTGLRPEDETAKYIFYLEPETLDLFLSRGGLSIASDHKESVLDRGQ